MPTANNQVTQRAGLEKSAKNPKRVAAGRLNRMRRKGLTAEGWERLRQTALANQPWKHSTGPKTPEGKARSAANGKKRQLGPRSVREIKHDLAGLRGLLGDMRSMSQLVQGVLPRQD